MPSWEKSFCSEVGLLKWGKIVETRKYMYLFENVMNWNESAVEETFNSAKTRFYAKINNLPCDIPFPDPDLYIDEIDWDSEIDPELLLDLEREPEVQDTDQKGENVIIFGDALLASQGFSATGWGESEDELKRAANSSFDNNANPWEGNFSQSSTPVNVNGWRDFGPNLWNQIEANVAAGGSGWGDGWNSSSGWNSYENNTCESRIVQHTGTHGVWGIWHANNRKREDTVRYLSRYKTSRFHGLDYERNGNGGRRGNFVWEQPTGNCR